MTERVDEVIVYEGDRRLARRRYRSPEAGYDVVLDGPGTAVLALTPDGDVVLTRQFRPGAERLMWDLPGGFVDEDEEPAEAATRELREETGFEADGLEPVTVLHPGAYSTERRHVFIARGCRRVAETDTDPSEDIEVRVTAVDELLRLLRAGELTAVDAAYVALDRAGLLGDRAPSRRGVHGDGEPDGFHGLVGVTVEDLGDRGSRVTVDAGQEHLNRHGTVHGGAIATLADAAMGAAVAADGSSPVTVEMKVTYIEPARPGRLVAEGKVRRRGKHISIVEADIFDADGAAVAHGIATFTTI